MQADEYGQTRGTRFVARRLEVVAVAGLLWISWCVLGAAGFFLPFFCLFFFFFERTRPAASMRPPCLIYLHISTNFESCTRPMSTNPGFMEAGVYGRTRGTCVVARRLEVVDVAGLLSL